MEPISHWPFVESPSEFAARLRAALVNSIDLRSAVCTVLIDNPPTINDETVRRIKASST